MANNNTSKIFTSLSEKEESLGKQVVNIAFIIHKALGPGLLESVYEKCFCYELAKRKSPFNDRQPLK